MKRAALRHLLAASGLTGLRWRMLRPGLYCFNYHRVGDPDSTIFDRGVFSCSAEHLRDHVALLAERFTLLSVDQLLRLQNTTISSTKKPFALITFDDGYIDNYTVAYPILKAHRAPALFFIPTDFVGSAHIPWWDEIAWLARSATVHQIQPRSSPNAFQVGPAVTESMIIRLLRFVKQANIPMAEQLAEIREQCRPTASLRTSAASLFTSWEQLKVMLDGGMSIGSHTHTHPILSTIDPAKQSHELSISKSILEGQLKCPVTALAYPVGTAAAFTEDSCRIARDVGYRIAFTFERHMNQLPLPSPFAVGRYAVDDNIDAFRLRSMVAFPFLA